MKIATLCFLIKDNKILLAMKKRGFGTGKWNGVGGKINPGETIKTGAAREAYEEIGVNIKEVSLRDMGTIDFYFQNNTDWNQRVYIFLINEWEGKPQESEEMKPMWYDIRNIPYKNMWLDDPHWLPKVLEGKKIKGEFHFISDNNFEKFKIEEITS